MDQSNETLPARDAAAAGHLDPRNGLLDMSEWETTGSKEDSVSSLLQHIEKHLRTTTSFLNAVRGDGSIPGVVRYTAERESQYLTLYQYLLQVLGLCFDDSQSLSTAAVPPDSINNDSLSIAAADLRAYWSLLDQAAERVVRDLHSLEESTANCDLDTESVAVLRSDQELAFATARYVVGQLSGFFPCLKQWRRNRQSAAGAAASTAATRERVVSNERTVRGDRKPPYP